MSFCKKIMPPKHVEPDNVSVWAECVGGLILNFGMLEFQSVRWIEVLSGVDRVLEMRSRKLSQRIRDARDAFSASAADPETKTKVSELWDEATELAKTRNRIAHNPMVLGRRVDSGELAWSVIDLQKMRPIGGNVLEPLDPLAIQGVALRVRDIALELSAIIEAIPSGGTNPLPKQ